MRRCIVAALLSLAFPVLGLAGCNGTESPVAAQTMPVNASATATVGGATLQASTVNVADLNNTVANRYAINPSNLGVVLLLTVRDASGNAIELGDLSLDVTAGALPDALRPFSMRPITTDGMTDYIGVFNARPPATVQFRIRAVRNGKSAEISTTAEFYSR